jgi:hypothetical protein
MHLRTAIAFVILTLGLVHPARAQVFLTPYVGTTFSSSFDDYDDFGNKLHYGGALTWLGQSGLGFELDFGYAPTFFNEGADELFEFESDGNLTTFMANLVVGRSGSGLQPYLSGGFGLIRSDVRDALELFEYTDNGFGVNVGAGLFAGGSRFGLRGDLRYYRQLTDLTPIRNLELGDFTFWRASAGLAIGF